MATWQQRYRIDWDAIDGRNGGAQRIVWENWVEVERLKHRAGEEDLGAVALAFDLAKAFKRVSFFVVWAWSTHCFEHQKKVQFEGCVTEQTITAILPGSK